MTPRTHPTDKKLPRARVKKLRHEDYWMAVIPTHTPAAAKRIVKLAPFLQMTEEEQRSVVSQTLVWACGTPAEQARAVIRAMTQPKGRGEA